MFSAVLDCRQSLSEFILYLSPHGYEVIGSAAWPCSRFQFYPQISEGFHNCEMIPDGQTVVCVLLSL